jgi:hypothetical protein
VAWIGSEGKTGGHLVSCESQTYNAAHWLVNCAEKIKKGSQLAIQCPICQSGHCRSFVTGLPFVTTVMTHYVTTNKFVIHSFFSLSPLRREELVYLLLGSCVGGMCLGQKWTGTGSQGATDWYQSPEY